MCVGAAGRQRAALAHASGGACTRTPRLPRLLGDEIMNIHKWNLGGKAPATHSSDPPPARAATALVLLRCPRGVAGARRGWAAPRRAPHARLPSACCTHPSRRMGLLRPCRPCAYMHIYTHTGTHMHKVQGRRAHEATDSCVTHAKKPVSHTLQTPVPHTLQTPVSHTPFTPVSRTSGSGLPPWSTHT